MQEQDFYYLAKAARCIKTFLDLLNDKDNDKLNDYVNYMRNHVMIISNKENEFSSLEETFLNLNDNKVLALFDKLTNSFCHFLDWHFRIYTMQEKHVYMVGEQSLQRPLHSLADMLRLTVKRARLVLRHGKAKIGLFLRDDVAVDLSPKEYIQELGKTND